MIYTKFSFLILLIIITSCTNKEKLENLTFVINGENFEMILVKGGTFIMGCTKEQCKDCDNNEKPVHKETVSTFYIGKYEVTQKLWKSVMNTDSTPAANIGCDNCPVEQVSWVEVQKFINKLNTITGLSFRLPTEKEWEYAARGGEKSRGFKYSGSNNIDEVAWYINNYKEKQCGEKGTTHFVGMKKSNELGIYDMSGNVWEWCDDLYTKEYYHNGKPIHPEWPLKGSPRFFRRILRGGSWGGTAFGCRVSYIDYDLGSYNDEYGGFRLALNIK